MTSFLIYKPWLTISQTLLIFNNNLLCTHPSTKKLQHFCKLPNKILEPFLFLILFLNRIILQCKKYFITFLKVASIKNCLLTWKEKIRKSSKPVDFCLFIFLWFLKKKEMFQESWIFLIFTSLYKIFVSPISIIREDFFNFGYRRVLRIFKRLNLFLIMHGTYKKLLALLRKS